MKQIIELKEKIPGTERGGQKHQSEVLDGLCDDINWEKVKLRAEVSV